MSRDIILKMVDGGIVNIESDNDYSPGCETCDYGSVYVTEFNVELTKMDIYLKADKSYDYPFSEGQMMKVILPNTEAISKMTEEEFCEWIVKEFTSEWYELKHKVRKR